MIKKNLICISCPIGCRLEVEYNKDRIEREKIAVSGNKCPKGIVYGVEEVMSPRRTVTATAAIGSVIRKRLSVKTSAPISKEYIFRLLEDIYNLNLKPPVGIGDTIIDNYRNTGVDVVSTMELKE